jgi:Ser/Thr protein kinase RdoA (MazF antagonist)
MNVENNHSRKPSYLAQVRGLRALANEVIKHYSFTIKNIEFIKYSANAIFRITDIQHKQYALRINPEKHHQPRAILEEIQWMNHILETTDLVTVQVPRAI